MGRAGPASFNVTAQAESRAGIIHDQETPILVIVRIMARDALHFVKMIKLEPAIDRAGEFDGVVETRDVVVVNEGDRMVA